MKIGLLAYSTNTGLGYQTLEFYKNMKPDKVLVADIERHNGMRVHHERFPGARVDYCVSPKLLSNESCEWLVDGMDVIFVCETPLNHYLFEYAKRKGVKTVLQYNYEFLPYFLKPNEAKPDILASPTKWGMDVVEKSNIAPVTYWPVPINTDEIPFRKMHYAETFVHIIGRPTAADRNGTIPFLKAVRHLGDKFKYKVYYQQPTEERNRNHFAPVYEQLMLTKDLIGENFEIIQDVEDNMDMYRSGEILVLPRRYGGLCLPMWEALASGMPVIMTGISPNNSILPPFWLVNSRARGALKAHSNIVLYEAEVLDLVNTMIGVANNVQSDNEHARRIAESMSWKNHREIYTKRLEELCAS